MDKYLSESKTRFPDKLRCCRDFRGSTCSYMTDCMSGCILLCKRVLDRIRKMYRRQASRVAQIDEMLRLLYIKEHIRKGRNDFPVRADRFYSVNSIFFSFLIMYRIFSHAVCICHFYFSSFFLCCFWVCDNKLRKGCVDARFCDGVAIKPITHRGDVGGAKKMHYVCRKSKIIIDKLLFLL